MVMYLLDTNICIAILKNNSQVIQHFQIKYHDCYLSSLVLAELYKDVYCSTKVKENLKTLDLFVDALPTLEFDEKAAIEFGKIQSELRKIGKPTGELDALIAAVARCRQDIVVTNNIRHFANVPTLKLENWFNS
jgi:tRNA(fMet)-specific endonuclease VapC